MQHFFDNVQNDVNSFNTYIKYLAIKRHFTTDTYDYFKYHGKVRGSKESFAKRKDCRFFSKISKYHDPEGLIVANIVKNPSVWVGDIADSRIGEQIYVEWKKRTSMLTSNFKEDLNELIFPVVQENFVVPKSGDYPVIVEKYFSGDIAPETFAILLKITKTKDYILENVSDKIYLGGHIAKMEKYLPFVVKDFSDFSEIFKQKIKENS